MHPLTIQQSFDRALAHHQAGRLREAEDLYRQILARQPEHADSLHLLGVIVHQAGRFDLAADLIRQAIALGLHRPDVHYNLGSALKEQGQLDEAIAAYRLAIARKPDFLEAWNNLGLALRENGHFDEAIAACRQAIALQPCYPKAHSNLGNALAGSGQLDAAIAAYRQAIALNPHYAEACNNLGGALCEKGQLDEAISSYRRAIALQPGYAQAHSNLGVALTDSGQLDEAVAACRQAIALQPNYPDAHNNLGNALRAKGQLDEAIAAYRQAIAQNPRHSDAHSNLIFALSYHPDYDAPAIADELRRWNHQHVEPLRPFLQPHGNDRDPDRRLRIGYVSADFRVHVCAFFLVPLLEHHDPRQVEIFCYAQVPRPDDVTSRLQQHADQWRSTVGLSHERVARQIRDDHIDILVDLKLHTDYNRLLVFARKPAPLQVTWLGYPGSTGLTTIDYRLSDPHLDPPGMDESVYSEQTLRLPDTFWCYDPLDGRDIPVNALPALANNFITFGSLNNFCKINDAVLHLWARVLRSVSGSRLLLRAPEGSHRRKTLNLLEAAGIAPERIEFLSPAPRRQYLQLYQRIDLALDTFPYNGHTTSLDTFWMGVPVVTLAGQTAAGRAGLSQLMNLNLPDLVAHTPDQYVQIAASLCRDLPRLSHLRSTLRQRMEQSPLMDAPRFARNIEAAYRQIWKRWCAASAQRPPT